MDITINLKIHRIPTNNITVFTFHRIKYFSWNLRIYDYQKSVLTQIVLIMASVDLDAELDQITDIQSLFKYLYGEDEPVNIEENIVEENIVEELPNIGHWLDEL